MSDLLFRSREVHKLWGAHAPSRAAIGALANRWDERHPVSAAAHRERVRGEAPRITCEPRALPGKLLAQIPGSSQALKPMNRSGRSPSCARVVVTAVLFAAFSWTLLVSISPRLHGYIHGDANRSDHVCAITLIASGSYEDASQPPLISGPQFDICFAVAGSLTPTWVKPLFFYAYIFAHAPPAYS